MLIGVSWQLLLEPTAAVVTTFNSFKKKTDMRSLLLLFLGVPSPLIILFAVFFR